MPRLIYREPTGKAIEIPLQRPVLIGRSPDCNLQVKDAVVSKHHCLVFPIARLRNQPYRRPQWYVTDLDSSNGTYVNGEPLHGIRVLMEEDCIRFGRNHAAWFRLILPQ